MKTDCPRCGKKIELVPVLEKPGRAAAYCDCTGRYVSMIETDLLPEKKEAVKKEQGE